MSIATLITSEDQGKHRSSAALVFPTVMRPILSRRTNPESRFEIIPRLHACLANPLRNHGIIRKDYLNIVERAMKTGGTSHMESGPKPEQASMPIFILFDTQTGYLYGHLFATGPEDPFLQEVIDWWSKHCANKPTGLDYPGLTQTVQPVCGLSSN